MKITSFSAVILHGFLSIRVIIKQFQTRSAEHVEGYLVYVLFSTDHLLLILFSNICTHRSDQGMKSQLLSHQIHKSTISSIRLLYDMRCILQYVDFGELLYLCSCPLTRYFQHARQFFEMTIQNLEGPQSTHR